MTGPKLNGRLRGGWRGFRFPLEDEFLPFAALIDGEADGGASG